MRKPKSEERALWHHATRDVTPLQRHHETAPATVETPETESPSATALARHSPPPVAGLDRRSAQRLKRGQTPIEARLDLHGMTQPEAHDALASFIARCHATGLRAVLVITGKSGVLYGAVPRWLEEGENRARILATSRAQASHGGAGALYLLLRRRR
jgi:DNA-nicking Smr family endonuclease